MSIPIIFCIVGASGSGKTTLANWLVRTFVPVRNVVSCTTRPKRINEVDSQDHFFVNDSDLEYTLLNNKPEYVLSYTKFGGYEYWAFKDDIYDSSVNVYVIDENGINYLREHFSGIYDIYVCRLIRTTDMDISDIRERVERDKDRVPLTEEPDFVLLNNDTLESMFEKAAHTMIRLIMKLEQ